MIKVVTSNVEVGQGGGKDVSAKTVLRYAAARVLAAAGPHLPGADRRARGLRRPDDVAGEHPARRARVPQPGRRVAAQGDRGRARREAQGASAAAARDERARPERQRRGGLRLVGRATCSRSAGYQMIVPPERPARECAELRLLPHARSTSTRGVKGAKPAAKKVAALFGSADVKKLDARRSGRSATTRCSSSCSARRSTDGSRPRRSTRRRGGSPRTSSSGASAAVDLLREYRQADRLPADGADQDRALVLDRPRDADPHLLDRPGQEAQGGPSDVPARQRTSTGASR